MNKITPAIKLLTRFPNSSLIMKTSLIHALSNPLSVFSWSVCSIMPIRFPFPLCLPLPLPSLPCTELAVVDLPPMLEVSLPSLLRHSLIWCPRLPQ